MELAIREWWRMQEPTVYILSLHEMIKRKANWIGHILRRNCLLKQVIEGKIKGQIEVTRRRGSVRSYWTTLRTGEDTVN